MRNEQIKTAENNCYGSNWRKSTDFRVVTISKWKTWSRGTNSSLTFAVNAMLNLSYVCIIYEKTKSKFPGEHHVV